MKNVLELIVAVIFLTSLTACGKRTAPEPKYDPGKYATEQETPINQ